VAHDWPCVQNSGEGLQQTDARMRVRRGASGEQGSPAGPAFRPERPIGRVRSTAPHSRSEQTKLIFDFLRSRDARMACPFCGHEDWHGWDERVALEHVSGSHTVDRRSEAFPLTCANCGFIRLQSARVLDDPRGSTTSPPRA
jgi:transcription elongation factor Elf1